VTYPSQPTMQVDFTIHRIRDQALTPTVDELADVFDECERGGELSTDAWLAVRRLAHAMETTPTEIGTIVWWPTDPETELQEHVAQVLAGEGAGMRRVLGCWITDVRGRHLLLVTLHGDDGSIEAVPGLFRDPEAAEAHLKEYGVFSWDS
jgi:hypothetical protein